MCKNSSVFGSVFLVPVKTFKWKCFLSTGSSYSVNIVGKNAIHFGYLNYQRGGTALLLEFIDKKKEKFLNYSRFKPDGNSLKC